MSRTFKGLCKKSEPRLEVNHWLICITEDNLEITLRENVIGFVETQARRLNSFRVGDLVIFYVSRKSLSSFGGMAKCSGVARITGEDYVSSTRLWNHGVFPIRIDIKTLSHKSCDFRTLISNLTFIKNKAHWGASLMPGIIKIPAQDFETIQSHMK